MCPDSCCEVPARVKSCLLVWRLRDTTNNIHTRRSYINLSCILVFAQPSSETLKPKPNCKLQIGSDLLACCWETALPLDCASSEYVPGSNLYSNSFDFAAQYLSKSTGTENPGVPRVRNLSPSRNFQANGRLLPTLTPAGTWRRKVNKANPRHGNFATPPISLPTRSW